MSPVIASILPAGILALAAAGSDPLPGGAAVVHAASAPERVLQVRARELWTASGERITDGLLVVVDGKIESAGPAKAIDPGQPLIQHDGIVTAGLIACRTQSGTVDELQDDTRSVLVEGRAAFAFDPSSRDFRRALSSGVTSLLIAPGPANLVGGLACVVKTTGRRVLEPEAALALSLTSHALGRATVPGGFLFGAAEEEEMAAAGDEELAADFEGGPEMTARTTRGTREPTSYAGAVALLEQLFARGNGPFGRARRGVLQVTIEAWDRHEVLRAVELAREHGLKGSIHGAPLAGDPDVVAALQASGLGVIVGPYSAQQTTPSLESVKLLSAAGVPVAFALDAPANAPLGLRLTVARAHRAGASKEAVWKALTEDAARIAGVGKAVGRLAPGYDGDFVLWSGDPLDLSSRIVAVYVDGERAWSEPTTK